MSGFEMFGQRILRLVNIKEEFIILDKLLL